MESLLSLIRKAVRFICLLLLAALVGPYLTPMDWLWSALAGAVIGVAGFLGDITISAVKRDLGVNDTGGLLPGHGGILDRVDSIMPTLPIAALLLHGLARAS